jgi:hypothetical protein
MRKCSNKENKQVPLIEESCGNVFKDIGFSDAEAASLFARTELMVEVRKILQERQTGKWLELQTPSVHFPIFVTQLLQHPQNIWNSNVSGNRVPSSSFSVLNSTNSSSASTNPTGAAYPCFQRSNSLGPSFPCPQHSSTEPHLGQLNCVLGS